MYSYALQKKNTKNCFIKCSLKMTVDIISNSKSVNKNNNFDPKKGIFGEV